MPETKIKVLRDLLDETSERGIEPNEVATLLSKCWQDLTFDDDGGMQAYKLNGRIESPKWTPPELTFKIERHGGTVMGSKYAELQNWTVNLDDCRASYSLSPRRRLAKLEFIQ